MRVENEKLHEPVSANRIRVFGTTILRLETGRRARVIELDPHYVDVAIKRWETWSGETARHPATGLTFSELTASRATEAEATATVEGLLSQPVRLRPHPVCVSGSASRQPDREESLLWPRKKSTGAPTDYEIGRGKPPKQSQFRKVRPAIQAAGKKAAAILRPSYKPSRRARWN